MKTIQKERVKKEYYDVYVAEDGTEFRDKEECMKYDESARCVLNSVLRKIMVKSSVEDAILGFGSCDITVEVYKPKDENDKRLLMQMYLLVNDYLKDEQYKDQIDRASSLIDRAINEDDYIIVGKGYDDTYFWFYGTRNSMKVMLDKFCTPKDDNA